MQEGKYEANKTSYTNQYTFKQQYPASWCKYVMLQNGTKNIYNYSRILHANNENVTGLILINYDKKASSWDKELFLY